jgi:hypothetical protein
MDIDLARRAFIKHKLPHAITVVRDGEEALACMAGWLAGAPQPGLILLDLKLPRVSGLEVLRQLKAHEQFRRIPVVVLTTSAEDRDVQTAYQLGANSYVVKPVSYDQFMDVTRQIERYWCALNTPPR